jgi:hypothetical protein
VIWRADAAQAVGLVPITLGSGKPKRTPGGAHPAVANEELSIATTTAVFSSEKKRDRRLSSRDLANDIISLLANPEPGEPL